MAQAAAKASVLTNLTYLGFHLGCWSKVSFWHPHQLSTGFPKRSVLGPLLFAQSRWCHSFPCMVFHTADMQMMHSCIFRLPWMNLQSQTRSQTVSQIYRANQSIRHIDIKIVTLFYALTSRFKIFELWLMIS